MLNILKHIHFNSCLFTQFQDHVSKYFLTSVGLTRMSLHQVKNYAPIYPDHLPPHIKFFPSYKTFAAIDLIF